MFLLTDQSFLELGINKTLRCLRYVLLLLDLGLQLVLQVNVAPFLVLLLFLL